ncbi:M56 family metallopeptidase [Streptomyces sporangiiformans]|uniref:M56 family metallopeptidase n=1 Tax=Streptomyces sporangiiformans TaxID=2315329 RepID=A0A505DG09_9ACTN|nr:M56 family metallopeptidase [Streptomyces sporangiiformans]TPQ20605.1 M56 family metallopeptidase [Streptomyces sporangiiformans]
MTAPLLLASYLAVTAVPVSLLLRRARWVVYAPRTAIAVWFGLLSSWVGGAILLGCEVTEEAFGSGLWECCLEFFAEPGPSRHEAVPVAVGVVLVFGVPARVITLLLRDVLRRRRRQLRLAEALDVLGRPVKVGGGRVMAIDHECPAAYCVAARGGRIVLTTAALRTLPQSELSAVVAHEKAHLEGRHYLLTTAAASLARALPGVPLFTSAGPAVARLAEMAADDAAARGTRRETVARGLALLVAAQAGRRSAVGTTVLQASADHVAERINRLLDIGQVDGRRSVVAGAGWFVGLAVAPAFVIAGTAVFCC